MGTLRDMPPAPPSLESISEVAGEAIQRETRKEIQSSSIPIASIIWKTEN